MHAKQGVNQPDAVIFSAVSIRMSRQHRRSQPVGEACDRAMLVSTGVISEGRKVAKGEGAEPKSGCNQVGFMKFDFSYT